MTIAIEQTGVLRRAADGNAANDDHVNHTGAFLNARDANTSNTGGWDAYEVWRRLIKEARDRRAGTDFPQR